MVKEGTDRKAGGIPFILLGIKAQRKKYIVLTVHANFQHHQQQYETLNFEQIKDNDASFHFLPYCF